MNIGFSPITDEEYEDWVSRQGKNRYILTVIGRSLSARDIAAAKIVAAQGLNIDSIIRLTGRPSIMHPERNVRACIEFSLRGTPEDRQRMQAEPDATLTGHGYRLLVSARRHVPPHAPSDLL